MRHTPAYLMTDPAEVKRLIRNNPWATFVSATSNGLIASHYPVLLAEDRDEITIVSHFGRPDETLHELGSHEILVIIQGPHDYVSPSWYAPGDLVPTWNHVTAHLYGTPEILSDEETTTCSPVSPTTLSSIIRAADTSAKTNKEPAA
jgi:transcriptional regulator